MTMTLTSPVMQPLDNLIDDLIDRIVPNQVIQKAQQRAERQKAGLSEKKRSGAVPVLVKLQRPPPEMRTFARGCALRSIRLTRHLASVSAHVMAAKYPAAPPPTTTTCRCFSFRHVPPTYEEVVGID